MSFVIGSFRALLGIDTTGYARGILSAQAVTAAFGQTFANFVSNPLAGAVGLLKDVGGGFLRASKDTLAWAESLALLSKQTGVTTTTIQALREALAFAGDEGSKADQILVFLTNRLGEIRSGLQPVPPQLQHVADALAGVTSTEEGLRIVLNLIARAPDEMSRMQIAADLLGKQAGGALVAALGGGSKALDEQIEKFGRLGKIVQTEALDPILKLATNVDELTFGLEGVKRTFITEFLAEFARGSAVTEGQITRSIESVVASAARAAARLGGDLSDIVGRLDEIVDRMERIVSLADRIPGVGDRADRAAIDTVLTVAGGGGVRGAELAEESGGAIHHTLSNVRRLRRRAGR